jgi:hypothetical protein
MLLWDLAIAATGFNQKLSAEWSIEMYHLASNVAPGDQPWQRMNGASSRKNALTVLSLTDPARAAEHYLELAPSAEHQPNEDPRIDLARHLFPRLWDVEGERALPLIERFAAFTSRTGQYPYIGIGHILPQLARVDRLAARRVFQAAVRRLAEEHIWRALDDYLKFLREYWPVASARDRRLAVEAALAVVQRAVADKATAMPGSRSYAEYYLPGATVRLGSEEESRVYDFLPFVDAVDRARGRRLRQRYPALAHVPVLALERAPWRSGVFAAAGRDRPELVEAAFERHHLMFLKQWAAEDARRAAEIARATKDPTRRLAAMALILPAYTKVDPVQAETWRHELMASGVSAETSDDLAFLVALTRAHFAMGHQEDGIQATRTALRLGEQLASKRDLNRPVEFAQGAGDLRDLADGYGEFQPNDLAPFAEFLKEQEPALRLYLLAGVVRGAMRHRPGYREPN